MSDTQTRVAIVTGAAQGIGKAIALRLADDGLNVCLNDIPSKSQLLEELVKEIKKKGREAIVVIGDVTKEDEVVHLVRKTAEQLGSVDVMIANAGIGISAPLIDTSVDEFELVHSINVKGVFLCYREAAKQMIKQGRGGRIIGASSIAGKKGSALWTAYCSSKFAVRGMTQSAAAELWDHGITVNAYAPGLVKTDFWTPVDENRVKHGLPTLTDKIIDKEMPGAPVLSPPDIAGLVSYLVKPEAKYVTGQAMNVNGGWHMD